VQCIRDNLLHCRLTGEVRLDDVLNFLRQPPGELFDLIFADPPYIKSRGALEEDPLLAQVKPFLAQDGLFIWEHYSERVLGEPPAEWEVVRQRNYGETGLTFLRFSHKK